VVSAAVVGYIIPDTLHTRKHHFSACFLYVAAGRLLAAQPSRHSDFCSSHFTPESVSVFIRRRAINYPGYVGGLARAVHHTCITISFTSVTM